MKLKTFPKSTGAFPALQSLAVSLQTESKQNILAHLAQLKAGAIFRDKPQAQSMLVKLERVVATGQPEYAIFAEDGNSKLPFVAFSSLPGVTCPGAGECLQFCYSYRAWRFAHSYGRMAQNAYLLRKHPQRIAAALRAIAAKKPDITLRLYVDGDFASTRDVSFWFALLNDLPSIKAYGYSKSFTEILRYKGAWPTNYRLNISGGHAHSADTVAAIKQLPITRGEFVAVSIGRKVHAADHGTQATNAAIRAAMQERVFPCPGTCGTCTSKGHACGSEAFKGIKIAIAMH